MIRDIRPEDAAAVANIYNHYVLETVITFETDPVTAQQMQTRIDATLANGFPWIVLETPGGDVVGYAYADFWRKRIAYQHSVESAVYIADHQLGNGYGEALYRELIDRLAAAGNVHVVIGVITVPNPASVHLHQKLGFQAGAIYRQVGRKFDRWIDVQTLQLKLD